MVLSREIVSHYYSNIVLTYDRLPYALSTISFLRCHLQHYLFVRMKVHLCW